MKYRALLITILLILFTLTVVHGQEPVPPVMLLSGGGDAQNLDTGAEIPLSLIGFAQAAQQQARRLGQTAVNILIVPTGLTSNPFDTSPAEQENLVAVAQQQGDSLEAACLEVPDTDILPCQAQILPVFLRTDATRASNLALVNDSVSAIYFLDGNHDMAMRILSNTPIERAIADAYQHGVLIAGDGEGADILSIQLLAGYEPDFSAENALAFGAIDLRTVPGPRGLLFGQDRLIIQSELFSEGRLGLLLNALADPESVNVGLGIDRSAGVEIQNASVLSRVYGEQTALIVDAETYHAADSAQYRGGLNYLSLRNVIVHSLTAGDTEFNFNSLSFAQNQPPKTIDRRFETLSLPAEAGSLYLLSTQSDTWSASTLLNRFVNEAGGQQARVLHVLLGYPDADSIQAQHETINRIIGLETFPLVIDAETPAGFEPELTSYDAILLSLARRQQYPALADKLAFLRVAWFGGKPILAAGEATVVLGTTYLSNLYQGGEDSSTPNLVSFDPSQYKIAQGLNLLPVNLEISLTASNRWGGFFSLAYANPGVITLGMADQTAIILRRDRTGVEGENIVASLDLRNATLGEANSNVRFINGLLDIFAPGDRLDASNADTNAAPIPAATPVIIYPSATPTATPTLTATPAPTNTPRIRPPTRTPRPSPTTPISPPPRDPTTSNLMLFLSILMVIVIILGVLINLPRPPRAKE